MFAQQTGSAVLLLFSFIVGVALGCFYDSLRMAIELLFPSCEKQSQVKKRLGGDERQAMQAMFGSSAKISASDVLSVFTDLLFFVVAAASVIVLLFHLGYGRVRLFSLVSAVTGYTVYRLTIGKAVKLLLKKELRFLARMLKKAIAILLSPLILLGRRTFSPIVLRISRRLKQIRAKRLLAVMEETERSRRKKRKIKNERDKSKPHNRKGKRAVS